MQPHTKRRIEEVYQERARLCAKMEASQISAEGRLRAAVLRVQYERQIKKLQEAQEV